MWQVSYYRMACSWTLEKWLQLAEMNSPIRVSTSTRIQEANGRGLQSAWSRYCGTSPSARQGIITFHSQSQSLHRFLPMRSCVHCRIGIGKASFQRRAVRLCKVSFVQPGRCFSSHQLLHIDQHVPELHDQDFKLIPFDWAGRWRTNSMQYILSSRSWPEGGLHLHVLLFSAIENQARIRHSISWSGSFSALLSWLLPSYCKIIFSIPRFSRSLAQQIVKCMFVEFRMACSTVLIFVIYFPDMDHGFTFLHGDLVQK